MIARSRSEFVESCDTHADFAAALGRLRARLRVRASFLTQNAPDADDLVQSACERALLSRQRFQDGTNLHAWLSRIMRNLFVDACRARPHLVPLHDEPAPSPDEAALSPHETISTADVIAAMEALTVEDRRILDLALFHENSYRDIARDMGLALATTGTRLHRARAKLKRILQRVHDARTADGP